MTDLLCLVFVLLLTLHSVSVSRSQCQSCDETSCNCSGQNLTEVPAAPSKLIAELNLSFNKLRIITENDFVAYASLRSLIMKNNLIKKIHEEAFVPLTNLEKLDLSFNRLDLLSAKWFEKLYSLQHLNLLGNQYKVLGQGNLFQPLKRLKTLYFGGFSLQSVRDMDFSGLSALEELIFDGQNLQVYAERSLRQIGAIKHVQLGLNGSFFHKPALVKAVLSDVAHPNTTLTFTDTFFQTQNQMFPFRAVNEAGTTRVILKNIRITTHGCLGLLNMLSNSNVTMLALEDAIFYLHFEDTVFYLQFLNTNSFTPTMKHLDEVDLRNIHVLEFYNFPDLLFLKSLLEVVRRVTVINCTLFAIPCKFSIRFSKLEYIDFSENILTDLALGEMMCDGEGGLWSLQTLNVSRNHLRSIDSRLFTKLDKLENIDMSGNRFLSMPKTCHWPHNLHFLNLSSTHLRSVTACLPTSLRILDVSNNALTVFDIELPFLTDLFIARNKLISLPDGSLYPRLTFLFIQNNSLHMISSDDLNKYDNLKSLEAATDTYVCSCDFVVFMNRGLTHHRVTVGDKLKSYICDSPDAVRGERVEEVRLSVFECHTAVAFSTLCLFILAVILLVVGLCHKFSVLWYAKMTWAWLRAKRKPKLKKGELEYDAFVSYSEMDSGWVETHLIPELEQAEPPLRLCIHKRDFIPGGWILDNIMDAIEKSHRTLFVLSQHFVRSEWCKYELDYTHFRLFDHNDDAVVLILLEPIDQETLPKKFCKLRRVMNSRTYLEWPDDDNQIPRFWQSLRTAIKRPETDDGNRLN